MQALHAVQLASLLGAELGLALPSTLAFDFPTIDAIVSFLILAPEEVCLRHYCLRCLQQDSVPM
jgi:hypothetical protein